MPVAGWSELAHLWFPCATPSPHRAREGDSRAVTFAEGPTDSREPPRRNERSRASSAFLRLGPNRPSASPILQARKGIRALRRDSHTSLSGGTRISTGRLSAGGGFATRRNVLRVGGEHGIGSGVTTINLPVAGGGPAQPRPRSLKRSNSTISMVTVCASQPAGVPDLKPEVSKPSKRSRCTATRCRTNH